MTATEFKRVHRFWSVEACGTDQVREQPGTRAFLESYTRHRFETMWWIRETIPFEVARGKKVLEIGCGNGADGIVFAEHGAHYTGVDLTETAVGAAKRHFEMMGYDGVFQTENAERLSFEDESFDIVYAFGVLHHTPSPVRAIDEVFRVLRPGGFAIVMLYHKRSFNYYVRIMGFMRARVVLTILSRIGHWRDDRVKLSLDQPVELRGNRDRRVWNAHYAGFLEQGWRYLGARSFVHHCTDGPACPLAYTFTRREAMNAFSAFSCVDAKVAHLPFGQYTHGWFPRRLERWLAPHLGWNLVVFAHK